MISWRLYKWFWAMFEPTSTLPNVIFGQRFIWIGYNNYQICLPTGHMNDFEQYPNRFQLDLMFISVNFFGQNANYKWRSYQADSLHIICLHIICFSLMELQQHYLYWQSNTTDLTSLWPVLKGVIMVMSKTTFGYVTLLCLNIHRIWEASHVFYVPYIYIPVVWC